MYQNLIFGIFTRSSIFALLRKLFDLLSFGSASKSPDDAEKMSPIPPMLLP
jgi:hypothetical protein